VNDNLEKVKNTMRLILSWKEKIKIS
jgi:hypothetical protein